MSYQDLDGGFGRGVFYRARRHRPKAIFGTSGAWIRIGEVEGRLVDLSSSGLACDLPDRECLLTPGVMTPVQIWVAEQKAFSALAEVVRSEPANARLGLRFVNAVLEPDVLKDLASGYRTRLAMRDGASIYGRVPNHYRAAVHEAATVLSHWKRLLAERESEIRASARDAHDDRLAELEIAAEKQLRIEWFEAHARANEQADQIDADRDVFKASKSLTELVVTPLLVAGPIWKRAYEKPRGYPGDFELMNYMYEDSRLGDSIYGRIVHQIGRDERLASTVRSRRDLLVRELREVIARAAERGQCEVRICNIGAGPARELEDLLRTSSLPVALVVSLIDQDEDALAFAHDRLRKAALVHGVSVDLRCRYASFRQILSQRSLLEELQSQDLVYSAGLMDYLSEVSARTLIRQLAGLLCEGGSLFVGNAADEPGIKWVPEFVLDWHMHYRTADQMLELARDLPFRGLVDLCGDDSRTWHFLRFNRAEA